MKDYLVTWYGITDFRSSLGFEKSGPILGALADGFYTDVIVLGYSKQDDCISESEFESRLEEVQNSETPEDKFKFTYEYANCAAAHKHFIKFLGNKIVEMGKTISNGKFDIYNTMEYRINKKTSTMSIINIYYKYKSIY